MFKNILIPIDGSLNSRTAIQYGIWLAKRFKAVLTGLHVVDIVTLEGPFFHDLSGSLGFEPYLNFSTRMREILERRGKEILSEFESDCKKEKIKYDTSLNSGIITNVIVEKAKVADLIILGKRGINYKFEHGLLGSIAEGVLRKSPKPVMVVPKEFYEIGKPLLAYDGSLHASKVMGSAAEMAKLLKMKLTVLVVAKNEGEGRKTLIEAGDYLKPYNIDLKPVEVVGNPREEIIL